MNISGVDIAAAAVAAAPMNMSGMEEHSRMTMTILGSLYSLIFLIGITGNSLVVYVVVRNKTMQSVTNLFIMNLALSDILMCMLAVPFTPISFFQEYWVLGKFLCQIVNFSMGVSVYVSTLTSLAIAIDRYFVIVHPFKPRMKLSVCLLLIGVVWIVSISISLPLAIYIELQPSDNGTGNSTVNVKCQESWPTPMSRRFHNVASLVLQYLIPFTIITYSYTKVWIILSNRKRPGKTKEKEQLELKRKKKTNLMLVAMVFIFAVCWMPLNSVHFIMEFNTSFTKYEYFSTFFFIAHVIAMSSTIYNPFLYTWLNENFRKEFRQVIPCIFSISRWAESKTGTGQTQPPTRQNYNKQGFDRGFGETNGELETFRITRNDPLSDNLASNGNLHKITAETELVDNNPENVISHSSPRTLNSTSRIHDITTVNDDPEK